jgi:hypothetical protein
MNARSTAEQPPATSGTQPPAPRTTTEPTHRGLKLLGVTLLIPLAVAGILSLFAWPSANLEPRDLPLGVAGPDQMAGALAERLEEERAGAFELHRYADEAAARTAIEDREVYGAIVAAPDGITLLTASAASPLVAQLLTQAAVAPPTGSVETVDVVPTTREDPRGIVLGAAVLPLVFAGIATGAAMYALSRPGWAQATALVATSAVTGLAAVWIAQEWLGALGGDWWLNAGAIGLTVLAIAATVAGLGAAIGPAGLGLAALLMMFVGNPFSGVTSAPELLPTWAGLTGQLLPPGAGGTLLRGTAFFDGAAVTMPGIVLVSWVLLGLVGGFVGVRRHRAIPAAA